MTREGLIAHAQCCCEGCGRLKVLEKARQRRLKSDGLVRFVQVELLWVDVSTCRDSSGRRLYLGELATEPLFIDPAKLRIGSGVLFTPKQVFPAPGATTAPTIWSAGGGRR